MSKTTKVQKKVIVRVKETCRRSRTVGLNASLSLQAPIEPPLPNSSRLATPLPPCIPSPPLSYDLFSHLDFSLPSPRLLPLNRSGFPQISPALTGATLFEFAMTGNDAVIGPSSRSSSPCLADTFLFREGEAGSDSPDTDPQVQHEPRVLFVLFVPLAPILPLAPLLALSSPSPRFLLPPLTAPPLLSSHTRAGAVPRKTSRRSLPRLSTTERRRRCR